MKEIEYLSYDELLKKFNDVPMPKGNQRQLQKKRWEKQGYEITWNKDLLKYTVVPLTKTALKEKLKKENSRITYMTIAEPYILNELKTKERMIISDSQLASLLGLVNNVYNLVKRDPKEKEELSDDITVSTTKIDKFQETADEINREIIRRVLDSLENKQLISKCKCYLVKTYVYDDDDEVIIDENGEPLTRTYTTDKNETQNIMELQNAIASELKGKDNTPFYMLTKEEQEEVYRRICEERKFIFYYYVNDIRIDTKALEYEFDKKFNALKSKLLLNQNNRVRITNSSRGDFFKEIDDKTKEKLVKSLIDLKG